MTPPQATAAAHELRRLASMLDAGAWACDVQGVERLQDLAGVEPQLDDVRGTLDRIRDLLALPVPAFMGLSGGR